MANTPGYGTYEIPPLIVEILEQICSSVVQLNQGCWEWIGTRTRAGYASPITIGGRPYLVHRLTYAWFKADIPKGSVIDHLCRNKKCVNPGHLEAVTTEENVRRGAGGTETHCKNEHPKLENWKIKAVTMKDGKPGKRGYCKICYGRNKDKAAKKRRNDDAQFFQETGIHRSKFKSA